MPHSVFNRACLGARDVCLQAQPGRLCPLQTLLLEQRSPGITQAGAPAGASLDAAAAWDRLIGLVLNGCEAGRLASPAASAEQGKGKGENPGGAPRGPLEAGLSASAPSSSAAYVQVCYQGLLTWRLLGIQGLGIALHP